MPRIINTKEKLEGVFGQVFFQWDIPEYEQYPRTKTWYVLMIGVAIGLLIYSIIISNFLFAIILLLGIFIVFLRDYYRHSIKDFQITEDGIIIGNQFFEHDSIRSFYFVYNPPAVKRLYFSLKGFFVDELSIPLYDVNPLPVREKLLEYLAEDLEKEEESLSDSIEMFLKL